MATFGVGAVLALLGMGLGRDWLIAIAGVILFGGILLGLVARRRDQRAAGGESEEPGRS